MIGNPTVSVVVPIYNQQEYLNSSILSIINQTYKNLEIVLVNDGSTDSSLDIITRFALDDKRIKIIDKENGGLVSATVAGVRNSNGTYICFLDPDDYYGENFIENFMNEMNYDYDVLAAGYYKDFKGQHDPVFLKETKEYAGETLEDLRNTFLWESGVVNVSKQIFISRWNKMYKLETVKRMIHSFETCKHISLGEDSLFTYLVLRISNKVKALNFPNEYFYNIGNQSSMMKNDAIDLHFQKSIGAYNKLKELLMNDNRTTQQADALYYFLVNSLFDRFTNSGFKTYRQLCSSLRGDRLYHKTARLILTDVAGKRNKYIGKLKNSFLPETFFCLQKFIYVIKPWVKWTLSEPKTMIKDIKLKGIMFAGYGYRFRRNRKKAFIEIEKKLPLLEKRIYPYISDFTDQCTDLESCDIEKNIFVFWWDGFDKAPIIIGKCLESVKKFHPYCHVHEITKDNYQNYTDIDHTIIQDFNKGKISVQTFSDILRFNLLKNNGGIWIDATIYFAAEYDLLNRLNSKSFESVVFSSSKSFLKYDGIECSWSGYYIASRKNGVLVRVMDEIFKRYYLEYHTYSIYFFIDAAFMLCKKYGVDDAVLDKVHSNNNSMFLLSKILDNDYSEALVKQISKIPQKMSWFIPKSSNRDATMYQYVMGKEGGLN